VKKTAPVEPRAIKKNVGLHRRVIVLRKREGERQAVLSIGTCKNGAFRLKEKKDWGDERNCKPTGDSGAGWGVWYVEKDIMKMFGEMRIMASILMEK